MAYKVSSFKVNTYQVWQYHYAGNAVPHMEIESVALGHGIRNKAYIVFTAPSQGQITFPQAYEGIRIRSYLNFNQYQSIYSILQAEHPLYYHYLYDEPSGDLRGKTVPMIVFWLATEKEPTGEGLDRPGLLFPLRILLQDDDTPEDVIEALTDDLPDDIVEELTNSDIRPTSFGENE